MYATLMRKFWEPEICLKKLILCKLYCQNSSKPTPSVDSKPCWPTDSNLRSCFPLLGLTSLKGSCPFPLHPWLPLGPSASEAAHQAQTGRSDQNGPRLWRDQQHSHEDT